MSAAPRSSDRIDAFLVAASVPRDRDHASGRLDEAEGILAAHPSIASASVYTAAVLADHATLQRLVAADPDTATAKGGPHGWDALTWLCFSRYLQLDGTRSDAFVRAARVLLEAGASANTGWWEPDHPPSPEWEPVLYGAAGIAHHPELTRLLLEHGADPNDGEVVYHSPETRDNRALALLVETGRLTPESLALMLIRKHDWHDIEGARYLLEHGADPNLEWRHGLTALHHALERDNALGMFEALLDHGADPRLAVRGLTAAARAARRGRGDVLELLERRGSRMELAGIDALIAECARGNAAAARAMAARHPQLLRELQAMGGDLLARFSGTCNVAGVANLLDLGVDVGAPFAAGDGYFGEPSGSLAIHVAAWRACPAVVQLLLERGSQVDVPDPAGRTPLALAVRACVDSYWTSRRSPGSVAALLAAGASPQGMGYPCGYPEVDELLRRAGAQSDAG